MIRFAFALDNSYLPGLEGFGFTAKGSPTMVIKWQKITETGMLGQCRSFIIALAAESLGYRT